MAYFSAAEVTQPFGHLGAQGFQVSVAEIRDANSAVPLLELEQDVKHGKILLPNTAAYEQAVLIGNLLYRMQKPIAIVQAQAIDDVQSCVRFARKYNIKLTVKNGAHSFAGYCLNNGGIVLDLGLMNYVQLDVRNMIASFQGGAIWKDAYDQLQGEHEDKMVVGSQCAFVGVSGFTLGGGISPFSRSYGLGCDNILEMSVVTANGDLVTVSADSTSQEERDLFWALRGGGGGNFGITVAFKSRLHQLRDPQGRVVCGQLSWELPARQEDFMKMLSTFHEDFDCPEELTIDLLWTLDEKNNLLGQMTIFFNGDIKSCQTALAPLLRYNHTSTIKEMYYRDYAFNTDGFDINSKVYHHNSSLVFSEDAITKDVSQKMTDLMHEVAEVLQRDQYRESLASVPNGRAEASDARAPRSNVQILLHHIGGATTRVPKDATAFYWRDAAYVATMHVQWTRPEHDQEAFEFIQKVKGCLQPHTIEQKAAYVNFIDNTVPDWQAAYYGDNYSRLQRVKTTWDPTGFFKFNQSIEPHGVQPATTAGTPMTEVPQSWRQYRVQDPARLLSANTPVDVLKTNMEMRRDL